MDKQEIDYKMWIKATCTRGFESHPRQLIYLGKCDCFGCAVLLVINIYTDINIASHTCFALFVCLTLLASSFLPSHLSLKHVRVPPETAHFS